MMTILNPGIEGVFLDTTARKNRKPLYRYRVFTEIKVSIKEENYLLLTYKYNVISVHNSEWVGSQDLLSNIN